jgi:hypothetical protein
VPHGGNPYCGGLGPGFGMQFASSAMSAWPACATREPDRTSKYMRIPNHCPEPLSRHLCGGPMRGFRVHDAHSAVRNSTIGRFLVLFRAHPGTYTRHFDSNQPSTLGRLLAQPPKAPPSFPDTVLGQAADRWPVSSLNPVEAFRKIPSHSVHPPHGVHLDRRSSPGASGSGKDRLRCLTATRSALTSICPPILDRLRTSRTAARTTRIHRPLAGIHR